MNNTEQPKEKTPLNKDEIEVFSKELSKKIKKMNNKKASRSFSLRINPLFLFAILFVLFLLAFSLLTRNDTSRQISLDTLINGLDTNEYSQIQIQNDGKVNAVDKSYFMLNSSNFTLSESETLKVSEKDDFEVVTLDQFIDLFSSSNTFDQFRALFSDQSTAFSEIILGNDFILGVRGAGQKDLLVKGSGEAEFIEKLKSKKGMSIEQLPYPVKELRIFGKYVTGDYLNDLKASNQIKSLFSINNLVIVELKSEFVGTSYVDWNPSIYSFTDLLQNEGVDLTSENFEIVTTNIPSSFGFNEILNIVTLIGFVVLIFFLFRGAQSSGMGIMQFGQSKAKVFFGQKPDTTFDDVAGIDEARNELNEIVDFLKNPNKYRKLGARIPKGVLMVGPPGTGKTLLARAIAGEAKVPFFHTSGSEFEEMLVGAGASRVRDLFAKAKKAAPALIFIDEIDAVARKRGTKVQSGTTEQTLNQILVEMDGFEKNINVIILAATNRPDVLDPAILRPGRFDRQVRIDLPDVEGRTQILGIHGKNKPFAKDVDLKRIAKRTVGFTGADLENILNESAIIAANADQKEITNNDIDEAVSKVILGPAKKSRKRTDNELKLVAYHEAGHAVVAKYTKHSTPVDKISIVSRGSSGGVTMFLPENDEYIVSKNKLIADITVSLGGRAAEDLALGDVSTGASNDIEKATAVARRMIQRFGMSNSLGLVQYGNFEENEYLGYAYSSSKEYSEKTAEIIDNEVREIVASAYEAAKKVLTENRDKLDLVAKTLLEKEVLGKEDFDALF